MEKLKKFLKANILIIILAIVPPLTIWYFLQRDTKELEISIVANVPVISIEEKFADGIEVQFNKKHISSLYVIDIKIHNAGNRTIERSDFDMPLTLAFNGTVISPVQVVRAEPQDLPVTLETKGEKVIIKPMLLNSGDSFVLRTRVSDVTTGAYPVKANTRIKGVKKVDVIKAETDKGTLKAFMIGVVSSILAAISLVASIKLLRRVRGLVISMPGGIEIELSKLEKTKDTSKRALELANILQISRHDFKSNLLILRLKIEGQLRELARAANFGKRDQIGSISRISQKLEERGLIDHSVGTLIRDISPIMNRELHESESYLSEEEFAELQRMALSIVAALESQLDELRPS